MVRESRARKQKAVQWPPGGGSSAFCIAPRQKWIAETRPPPKVGPRTNPLGSGVARRRRGRPRFTFLRYITRLGVPWVSKPPGDPVGGVVKNRGGGAFEQ